MEGMGDLVNKITTSTGVDKLVKIISNILDKDCGCEERKEYLNIKIPFKIPKNR
jgi:hypothetical protein